MALPDQLPDGWFNFSPQDKVDFFNEQGVTPQDLMSVGVSQSEIAWMQQNLGYDPNQAAANDANNAAQASAQAAILQQIADQAAAEEAARQEAMRVAAAEEAARQEATRQEAARVAAAAEQERLIQQQLIRQNTRDSAADAGINLPQNWFDLSGKQKADWFVENKVTEDQLTQAGVPASDLQALKDVGYYDAQAREAELIQSNFVNIYNNNNLTTQQKAQQINQFAQQNNISRDQIASAMNLGANDLNAFLDTDPAVVQNRVNNLLQTATTEIKYNDPRYTTEVRDDEGNTGYVWNAAGQQLQQEKQKAEKQLIALGYELFDPDGPEYGNEYGSYNTAPARWLSPQEAASVTGTKINNQLRNQAYIQSTENLASQLSPLANQLRQKLDAVNASGNLVVNQPARYYNEVANRLTQRTGITDLNDVGVRKLEGRWIELGGDPPAALFFRTGSNQGELYDEEIYNKKTGQVYEQGNFINLGTFGNKQDETSALLKIGPDGNIKLNAGYAYEQEAWKDVVTALAPIALNFVPGVGQVLGAAILPAGTSAAIQTAVGNAVLKAGIDVATGVPIETALKNGLVSVGINQGLPNLSGNAYIDNAVKAVSVAALTGGNVEAALVNSVISTGGKDVLGNVSLTGDKVVDSAIASAVSSGLSAAATGGDVGASVAQGFGSGLSAGINAQNQVTTIPGVPAQTITGAAGNDSIPANVGVDTVGGIVGADTVNAGVAENDVLDLIQRDIDTSVANNVQGNLNAEQEIQSATPVEPGTSDFTIPSGTTVGEFAEPGTGGFSRTPIVTTPPATSTTATDAGGGRGSAAGKTAEQEAKLNQIAQDLAAKRTTTPSVSDNAVIDYGAVSPESNAQGLSGTRADKIFETTARYVAAPALKGVGELIELGGVGYGALTGDRNNAAQQLGQRITTQGKAITLQQVLDEQKDIRNAIKNAPDVFGKLSDNLAAEQLNYSNVGAFDPNVTQSEIDTSMTLANKAVAGTIAAAKNPAGFGDWVLTELFQEPLPLGAGLLVGKTAQAIAKSDVFNRFAAKTLGVNVSDDAARIGLAGAVTTSASIDAAEAGLSSYKDVFDELKSRGFTDDYAHEQASKAFAVSAGTTLAVAGFVDKTLLEPFFSGANTSINKRLGTQAVTGTLTEGAEAAGQGAGEQYFVDGEFDYGKLADKIVLESLVGSGSNVSAQLGTDVIADKPTVTAPPSSVTSGVVTPPPSGSGVVIAVDPNTNQASVIDDGGNITIIPAEGVTPGQSITLPSTPVDTGPVVEQPAITTPPVTQPEVTAPIDTGPVVTAPIDTGPTVTTPDISVPPVVVPKEPSITIPGIVLQNNNDGTVLVLTNDGGAINIPSIDSVTNTPLVVGANVDVKPGVDPGTGTGTLSQPTVTPDTGQAVAPEVTPDVTPETTPQVTPEVTPEVTPQPETVTQVTTQPEVTPEVTPTVTPGTNVNVNPDVNVDEPIPPVDELSPVNEFAPVEDRPPPLPPSDKTEEDLLLEQIIKELEPTAPPIEGVPIPEPTFPEPPLIVPETPSINVDIGNQVRTRTVRPSVSPGSRVEESAQILPIRPGLSEGGTGGIEGTPEEEQQPVWNVRSLKLRRLLGI